MAASLQTGRLEMSTMKLKVCGIVVFSVIAWSFTAGDAAAQTAAGAADKGAALFVSQKCSLCHGMDGKGNQKGALDDVGSKLSAADIKLWITDPVTMAAKAKADRKPAMKPFAPLPKEDLDSLVAYLAAKKKK